MKKKWYHNITNNSGVITDQNYNWEDTLISTLICDTKLGNLSPLIYALPIWGGNELINSGATGLGGIMMTFGIFLAFVDVIAVSLGQASCQGEFYFSPISRVINTVLFSTAVYTVSLPAKLVAKVFVKKEFAHQNKLLKTKEGREILENEYKAKIEKKENKVELKRLKTQLSQRNYQAKASRKVARIDDQNKSIKSDIRAVERQIEDCDGKKI